MHSYNINKIINRFSSSTETGLSETQAKKLLQKYGKNELPGSKPVSMLKMFFMQFKDFMIYTLFCAAGISFAVSWLNGEPDFIEPSIILIIIIVNAVIGVFQEKKAEHSLAALKKMTAPSATVLRDSSWRKIPASHIVPGDIIMLETGYLIPADARIITSHNLMVDESSFTGESQAVCKQPDTLPADTPLSDRHNMVYSGCMVCYGHGLGIVCATGTNTELGAIADMLTYEDAPETPLQKRLAVTGKILSITALIICVIIFAAGVIMKRPIIDMFMTSVSLAVAAIPEGLPAIVTIMLSLGVTKMAENNAIIRKLPAVETLGSTTVICSDKTGTLTQNKMHVAKVYDFAGEIPETSDYGKRLLCMCSLCCNSIMQNGDAIGEPTENALLNASYSSGTDIDSLKRSYRRINEIPFDSARKLMTTLHTGNNHTFSITKGAPEMLIPLCSHYEADNGKILPLNSSARRIILSKNNNYASCGLRILAVAYKNDVNAHDIRNCENNLTFAGFVALIDPPRKEAYHAVKECADSGIRPVMITGDNAATAAKIASDLGITGSTPEVITGSMLSEMSDETLDKNIGRYRVFARVLPEHKLRIVRSLQRNKEIVAMTGDGINDAPALKAADIGCAMGITGTDVAKNASDMILEDDNFSTITLAVREGRRIYDNIKKSIHFLISCNIGEIITIFFAILFGLTAPLCAVQLLWINLITDSFPALSLGMEPPDKNIMKRPPVSPDAGIFSGGLGLKTALEGAFIGSLALTAYAIGLNTSPASANTMCFAVLGLTQLFHAFNARSEKSLFEIGFFKNHKLVVSAIICAFLQAVTICVPALNPVFNTVMLSAWEWIVVIGLSFMPIPVIELQKKIC